MELSSQFSALQTDPLFGHIILDDIWHPYRKTFFDLSQDTCLSERSPQFQCDFLCVVLSRFPRITRIPINVFTACEKQMKGKTFENVTELGLCNSKSFATDVLCFEVFRTFPGLIGLDVTNVAIDMRNCSVHDHLERVSLVASNIILSKVQTNHLSTQSLFSKNLRSLDFRPRPSCTLPIHFVASYSDLKELTLYTHCIRDTQSLNRILNLVALQTFTLYSYDNYYFSTTDHRIFENILDRRTQGHQKKCTWALEINGIPEKLFFLKTAILQVKILHWSVSKIFHKKRDGSVEWGSDVQDTTQAFHKFVVNNAALKTLVVSNNIMHCRAISGDPDCEDNLQLRRQRKGYERVQIVSTPTKPSDCGQTSDGYVTFIFSTI